MPDLNEILTSTSFFKPYKFNWYSWKYFKIERFNYSQFCCKNNCGVILPVVTVPSTIPLHLLPSPASSNYILLHSSVQLTNFMMHYETTGCRPNQRELNYQLVILHIISFHNGIQFILSLCKNLMKHIIGVLNRFFFHFS